MTTNQESGGRSRSKSRSHGRRQKRARIGAAPPFFGRGRLEASVANYPLIVVQAACHCWYGMHFSLPSAQVAIGVFQNLMVSK